MKRVPFLAIWIVMFSMLAATVEQANAATRLGGLDLAQYCRLKYSTSAPTFSAVATASLKVYNAGGWRCIQMTTSLWPKYVNGIFSGFDSVRRTFEYSIDMNDVCRRQYGSGAYASYSNWSNPYSWSCYR
jgi:hypothetical protein